MIPKWKAALNRVRKTQVVQTKTLWNGSRKWVVTQHVDHEDVHLTGEFQGLTNIEVVYIASKMTHLLGLNGINYNMTCPGDGKIFLTLYNARDKFLKLVLSSQDIVLG